MYFYRRCYAFSRDSREFRRYSLKVSLSSMEQSTFERWRNKNAQWRLPITDILQYLKSECYLVEVYSSCFPNIPWHMSASYFVVVDRTIFRTGYFISLTTPEHRSKHAAESCGCLAALQRIDKLFSKK